MSASSLYMQWPSQSLGDLQGLYRSLQNKALLGRVSSFLTGHSRKLLDLTTEVSGRKFHGQHYTGYQTVPISRIKGSEGRSSDFDCVFNPIYTLTRDRWISVAVAHSSGLTLPPVDLIQLGDDYYVRDGRHRISVAHAFGEKYIDAKVIVLKLEPVSDPVPSPVVANTPNMKLAKAHSIGMIKNFGLNKKKEVKNV